MPGGRPTPPARPATPTAARRRCRVGPAGPAGPAGPLVRWSRWYHPRVFTRASRMPGPFGRFTRASRMPGPFARRIPARGDFQGRRHTRSTCGVRIHRDRCGDAAAAGHGDAGWTLCPHPVGRTGRLAWKIGLAWRIGAVLGYQDYRASRIFQDLLLAGGRAGWGCGEIDLKWRK
jgi:hypothetical protein